LAGKITAGSKVIRHLAFWTYFPLSLSWQESSLKKETDWISFLPTFWEMLSRRLMTICIGNFHEQGGNSFVKETGRIKLQVFGASNLFLEAL